MDYFQLTGIERPHDNDVLLCSDNSINSHRGNSRFKDYINLQRESYEITLSNRKPFFVKLIVDTIRNLIPSGRFLIQDENSKLWSDVGDREAYNITRMELREKMPNITNKTVSPGSRSNVTQNGSMSTEHIREMLFRQMSVSSSDHSAECAEAWLPKNDISALIPSGGENDSNKSVIHDHHGRAFPLRRSFVNNPSTSNLKHKLKSTEDETDSMSGLSVVSKDTSFSNTTGISFTTEEIGSKVTMSEPPKQRYGCDTGTSELDNSLYLEGMMPQTLDKAMSGLSGLSGFSDERRIPGDPRRPSTISEISGLTEMRGASSTSNRAMSIASSRRCSSNTNPRFSNLDDLASVHENMSVTDSLFSMDEGDLEEWKKETMEWEDEAENGDSQLRLIREELHDRGERQEEIDNEIDNITEMSSMISDAQFY